MIRLFNIMINDNQISCDYEPELSGKSGHLSVSLLTQEVSNYRFQIMSLARSSIYRMHMRNY